MDSISENDDPSYLDILCPFSLKLYSFEIKLVYYYFGVFCFCFVQFFYCWICVDTLALSLVILKLADIFAATFIQEVAFTVPIIMPNTSEFLPNQIRLDLLELRYQFIEMLASGLLCLK
jgi:hypothetical protein